MKNSETLIEVGEKIRKHLFDADRLSGRADQERLSAGKYLIAIRPRVEVEGFGWNEWCEENVRRSRSYIAKLMKLAVAEDPEAAVEQDREDARRRKAEQRERDDSLRKSVCDVTDMETQQILNVTEEERVAAAAAEIRRQQAMKGAFEAEKEARRVQEEPAEPGLMLQVENGADDGADEQDDAEFRYSNYLLTKFESEEGKTPRKVVQIKLDKFRHAIATIVIDVKSFVLPDGFIPPLSFDEAQKALKELDIVEECADKLRESIRNAIIPE
jgi:hypothetical protein